MDFGEVTIKSSSPSGRGSLAACPLHITGWLWVGFKAVGLCEKLGMEAIHHDGGSPHRDKCVVL